MIQPIIKARNIVKQFGNVVANREVNLSVHSGEIHAVVGENGAGKTTLMNILYGLHQPDAGDIYLWGQRVQISSPRVAKKLKIGMVHQHFMLVPSFTVTQNIVLGYEPIHKGFLIDSDKAVAKVRNLCQRYNLHLPLSEPVANLSVGIQQRVEIIKALYRGAEILILDEPTAVLTPQEVAELFAICREMADQKKTILFISHKLPEVLAISDYITVMRQGKSVATLATQQTNEKELAKLVVGRNQFYFGRKNAEENRKQAVVLQAKNLSVYSSSNGQTSLAVKSISLQVRAGEVLGIAGVEGNGQSELLSALFGLNPVETGEIWLDEQDITAASPAQRRALGMGFIPEDRMEVGLCLQASIAENLIVSEKTRRAFTASGVLRWSAIKAYASHLLHKFSVSASEPDIRTGKLSGGNLQKVIAARELSDELRCLLLHNPTRGIDIGAVAFIYEQLVAAGNKGIAILLVSADLDELFQLSDRIAVIYGGQLVGEFCPDEITPAQLGLYMTGARRQDIGENHNGPS